MIISGHHLYARNRAGPWGIGAEPGPAPALLWLPVHQGSCGILVTRQMSRQRWFAIGPAEEEDRVEVEKSRAGGRDGLWEVTSGLER